MKDIRFSDLCVGIGFVVVGIAVFIVSGTFPTATYGIGSGGYPKFIAILMIFLGGLQTITVLSKGMPKPSLRLDKNAFLHIVATAAVSFIYVVLLNYIGFLLLTPVYLFGLMMMFGYKNYKAAAITSVCVSTVIFFLFTKVFMIFLPTFNLF